METPITGYILRLYWGHTGTIERTWKLQEWGYIGTWAANSGIIGTKRTPT